MKKYLRTIALLAALLLAACSDKEDVPKKGVAGENGTGQEEQAKGINDASKEAHVMAANTLIEIIDNYGYVPDLADFYLTEYDTGVVYAKLVDFNKDGKDELFVLFKANTYLPFSIPGRETDGYVIEIWGQSGKSYVPLYSRTVDMDECAACDLSVGLIEFKDGAYGYYESSAQTTQGTTFNTETIYFMGADSNFETTVFTSAHNEASTYEIDGEALEEEEFTAQRELYNGTDIPIIKGVFGTKSFVHGADSSAAVVNAIFERIEYAFDDEGAGATKVDPASVQQYAERVLYLNNVSANHSDDMDNMIAYVILYEDLQADLPSYDYFLVISAQAVAAKLEEVFGVELNLSKTNLPDPDEDMANSLIAYRGGAFYILPTDFSSPTVIRTVEKAWEVAEDTYYMVVSDIEFDEMTYYTAENITYEEMDNFLSRSITDWPIEARKYAVSDIRRYVLVEVVGDRPTVKYIGYFPLPRSEVQSF